MFTITIESDHEKIKRDGLFSTDEFDTLIKNICLDTEFQESSPGHYFWTIHWMNWAGCLFLT